MKVKIHYDNERAYTALKDAFAFLRKHEGYSARVNFSCCGNCGSYELGLKGKFYIFFHAQATPHLARPLTPANPLYLMWDGDAAKITKVLRAHGLIVDHDGTDERAIGVTGYATREAANLEAIAAQIMA